VVVPEKRLQDMAAYVDSSKMVTFLAEQIHIRTQEISRLERRLQSNDDRCVPTFTDYSNDYPKALLSLAFSITDSIRDISIYLYQDAGDQPPREEAAVEG
jgi:hypothetical protein